jgi:phosphate-selective porin OprO/OprP
MLTGEHYSKSYKGGKMKGIKIKNPFDFENGTGTGAWEIGARYEYLVLMTQNLHAATAGYNENSSSRCLGLWRNS